MIQCNSDLQRHLAAEVRLVLEQVAHRRPDVLRAAQPLRLPRPQEPHVVARLARPAVDVAIAAAAVAAVEGLGLLRAEHDGWSQGFTWSQNLFLLVTWPLSLSAKIRP